MNWIKKLFNRCDHEWEFVRNIHGDEINERNGKRSIWICKKCGKFQYRDDPELPLMEKLDYLYNKYYKNKYENWKNDHIETLNELTNAMIEATKQGQCWYSIILMIDDETSDKYYYEKWLDENKLKYEFTDFGKSKNDPELKNYNLKQYNLNIRWNYKY